MVETYLIQTFGCQQNEADSERLSAYYEARGLTPASSLAVADVIVLNTCVVRERAEEKVYGLVRNLAALPEFAGKRIVVTGCLVGAAARIPGGKMMKRLRTRLPDVELLPIEEVGFEHHPKRSDRKRISIPISNGCNNYCSYCIVPFSRGKEISRPFNEIVAETKEALADGAEEIALIGQNVNSYGADILAAHVGEKTDAVLPDGTAVAPVMVKHLGRHRIPTLFPHLLQTVAKLPGVKKVSFLSSNPWDFSDELIATVAAHPNIDRLIHLPVQAGSDRILRAMNRWYTRDEYLALVDRIRARIPDARFTTDIIVGFPGETEEDFHDTCAVVRQVRFAKAYLAWYSPRPGTAAAKLADDVPIHEKKRRYRELDELVLTLAGRAHLLRKEEGKARADVQSRENVL